MGASIAMRAVIAPLVVCASAVAVPADQTDDEPGKSGTAAGAEAEKAAGLHHAASPSMPDERPGAVLTRGTTPPDGKRAPFSGRGLTLQEKRIFVLGLEGQEKK